MATTLKERLCTLQQKAELGPISIEELLRTLSGKGKYFVILLLVIPFCLPIQIPGLSTPFGLLIALLGLRSVFGHWIWLPKRLLAKKISLHTLKTITQKTLCITGKIEMLIHPRLEWFATSIPMQVVNGLSLATLGAFLALPLPIPLSNLTAAWSIFFLALGALEDDGLLILIGYLISLATIGVFTALFAPLITHFSS